MAMQTYIRPFQPQADTTTLAVLATSSNITLPTPMGNRSFRIVVSGTQTIFWKYVTPGSPGAATVAASVPMLPGTVETFFLPNDATALAFIASGTGSTVYVTVGESA